MNRKSFVMIALGALVAGALVLVYAMSNAPNRREVVFAGTARSTIPASGGNVAETAATPAAPPSETSKVLYDFNALPNPVKRMLQQIADAAQSGDIEKMRPVFESNELKPMVTTAYVDDPIAFWRKASADGTGRDVLAAMLNVMTSGFVRKGQGKEEIFVWPYFAETDLAKRLIDFSSGLTYALDGGMQRVADKVFMLTPRNVQISAEERAQLIEKGFFNQS